jgi:hypothetical protein
MDGLRDRLTGDEIVAQIDRPNLRQSRTVQGEPALAVDLARAEVLRPVQRDQRPATEGGNGASTPSVSMVLKNSGSNAAREAPSSIRRIVGIAQDRGHAEQGLTVGSALSFLQRPLVREERWTVHEQHRERRQTDVGHAVFPVAGLALTLSGRPAQTSFNSQIRPAKAFTAASSQRRGPRRRAKPSFAM